MLLSVLTPPQRPLGAANTGATAIPPAFDRVLNLDVMMDNVGGDQQLMADVVSMMLEETPRLMSQIDAAVAQLDANAMQRAAHSLKGSVAIFGARDAITAAERLESAGRAGKLEDVNQLHAELQSRIASLMAALEQYAGKH